METCLLSGWVNLFYFDFIAKMLMQMTSFHCASLCLRILHTRSSSLDRAMECTHNSVFKVNSSTGSCRNADTQARVSLSPAEGWLMKHFQTVGSCFSEESKKSQLRSNISTGGGAELRQLGGKKQSCDIAKERVHLCHTICDRCLILHHRWGVTWC